jgi:hypothetical protein
VSSDFSLCRCGLWVVGGKKPERVGRSDIQWGVGSVGRAARISERADVDCEQWGFPSRRAGAHTAAVSTKCFGAVPSGRTPHVTVVQATENWDRNHLAALRRLNLGSRGQIDPTTALHCFGECGGYIERNRGRLKALFFGNLTENAIRSCFRPAPR